jgi:tetratricopeptide (TPR) repeat protein
MQPRALLGNLHTAAALIVTFCLALGSGFGQARPASFQLKPREPQTITVSLGQSEMSLVHLHLQGGIVGVKATAPDGSSRPLWLIDLGRGAELSYVLAGPGSVTLEITSFEKARLAEISLDIGSPQPADAHLTDLRDAEDLLANADLIRRHWPTAPKNMDAIQLYDGALALAEKLGDTPLQRLILTEKARHLIFRQNDFMQADRLLQRAVALPKANDAAQQALAWKTLSTARYDLGEYKPAIEAGLSSLDLYRETNDLYWQGIVLGNLSSVYAEIGQNTYAVAAAQEALNDAQQEGDTAGVVYCLSQLAGLYQQQGDLEDALRTFQQGLAWVSSIGYAPLVGAEIQKDLGGLYVQIGEWAQADSLLRRSIELENGHNDPISLEARGLLATVMQHQGRLRAAMAEDTAAIAMARQLALKQDEANLLLQRASIDGMLHHQPQALADIHTAKDLASQLASLPLEIEAETSLGDALLTTDPVEAEHSYRDALQLAQRTQEGEEQSLALAGMTKALAQEERWEEAADSIEAALKIVEASRGRFSNREIQVTYFSLYRSWYELAVDICMKLNQKYPTKGYDVLAFSYTERARARSLLDTLDSSGYIAEIPLSESLREEYARNQKEIAAQQASFEAASTRDSKAAANQLRDLRLEQQNLEARMRSADERLDSPLVSKIATMTEIQQQLLAEHSVVLSYWIGSSRSYRWLITPGRVSVEELPPLAQVKQVVLPLERMLQSRRPVPASGEAISGYESREQAFERRLQTGLTRAGSMFLAHVPKGTSSILVVSDGCIRPVPFAALRISNGKTTDYALRKYKFLFEPSASVALYLKQHSFNEQALHITIFADPVFSASDARLGARTHTGVASSSAVTDMQRLLGSLNEARSISQYLPVSAVTLKTGFDATPNQVRNLTATEAVILHFATHTLALSGQPEATGIALSTWDAQGNRQDGVFWLKDIYALHLPSALVVLSGCETGRLRGSADGEALNNLSYAFFFAGAHSVTGSLWAVDDDVTSRMMNVFYRDLLMKQHPADAALRDAQLKMLASPQTQSPTMWASFVVEGWTAAYLLRPESKATVSEAVLPMRRK